MQADNLVHRLPVIALTLSSIVLAASLFAAYRDMIPAQSESPVTAHQSGTETAPLAQQRDLSQLGKWHTFGNATAQVVRKPATPQRSPETRLKLTLKGLVFTGNEQLDMAIISSPGKPDKAYSINDSIPGNAKLHSIEADRILLERNGRLESLSLPRPRESIRLVDDTAES